jgi:hypothetical protein
MENKQRTSTSPDKDLFYTLFSIVNLSLLAKALGLRQLVLG